MKQDWTEQLRQRMADYEEPAPEGLWEAIDDRLAMSRRVRRRRRWAVAAAVMALLTAGTLVLFQRRVGQPAGSAQRQVAQVQPVARSAATGLQRPVPTADARVPETAADRPSAPVAVAAMAVPRSAALLADGIALLADSTALPAAETAVLAEASAAKKTPGEPHTSLERSVPPLQRPTADVHRPTADVHRPGISHRRASGSLTFSLRGSNLLAAGDRTAYTSTEPIMMTRSRDSEPRGTSSIFGNSDNPIYLIGCADDTEHQLPVSVGATVAVPLSGRWWVESGLTYTYARSTFTTRAMGHRVVNRQTLRYVGLPLGAGYAFWQKPRLQGYATVGAEAAFNVSAKLDTEAAHIAIDRDRVQFSVGSALGAEFRVLPQVGVYVEPGLRYYPNNGSRRQNIFKDKPLMFDLQLGVRYRVK